MIQEINFKHSIIFFNICILISALTNIDHKSITLICLFLILTIGISHGSLDHIKGKFLLKKFRIKNSYIFFVLYILIAIFIIILWFVNTNFLILSFLIVAAYHFGKEDADFMITKKNKLDPFLFFLKGSAIISAPILFHFEETSQIFAYLNFDINEFIISDKKILIFLLLASLISIIIFSKDKSFDNKLLLLMDFLSILILNFFLKPLLAFTIYFCFLHSIRHSISLSLDLDKNLKKGFSKFVKKAIPLTLLTAIGFMSILIYLINNSEMNLSINRVIFIGLASLTFPHILLEYFFEKYEK